jgi:hypothetical protein
MKATLLIDVYSCFGSDKKKPLGVKGEPVTIIAQHDNCYVVQGSTKFTVTESEIKKA